MDTRGIHFALNSLQIIKIGGHLMMLIERDEVLTTDDAMRYLRISRPTFLKYIRVGRIRAIKAGKGWKVLQSELSRFLRGEFN
jgi:excisionase family DNA binding protein